MPPRCRPYPPAPVPQASAVPSQARARVELDLEHVRSVGRPGDEDIRAGKRTAKRRHAGDGSAGEWNIGCRDIAGRRSGRESRAGQVHQGKARERDDNETPSRRASPHVHVRDRW